MFEFKCFQDLSERDSAQGWLKWHSNLFKGIGEVKNGFFLLREVLEESKKFVYGDYKYVFAGTRIELILGDSKCYLYLDWQGYHFISNDKYFIFYLGKLYSIEYYDSFEKVLELIEKHLYNKTRK
ncbi:MAG: hypothetical protein ACP5H3_04275 [Candidatus Aenigmatarchaeota archaeon]